MTSEHEKDARTLARIVHEVGRAEMDEGISTAADKKWARALVASYREKIAEARRENLPAAAPVKKAEPIKKSYLAMARDALVALYTQRVGACGDDFQLAYRNLDALSDDDLRRLVQLMEPASAK